MTNTISRPQLGGVAVHMRGYVPPAESQKPGSFQVRLGPTLFQQNKPAPDKLFLGLLTKPPQIEGGGYKELVAPGYERIQLATGPGTAAFQAGNMSHIAFGPVDGWPKATHGALFDEAGTLLFYGLLGPHTSGVKASNTLEFQVQAVQIKLPVDRSAH